MHLIQHPTYLKGLRESSKKNTHGQNYRYEKDRWSGGRFLLEIQLSSVVKRESRGERKDKQSSFFSKISPNSWEGPEFGYSRPWLPGCTDLVPPTWNQSQGPPGRSPQSEVWILDSCDNQRTNPPPILGGEGAQESSGAQERVCTGALLLFSSPFVTNSSTLLSKQEKHILSEKSLFS